jgi:hypothetical protein
VERVVISNGAQNIYGAETIVTMRKAGHIRGRGYILYSSVGSRTGCGGGAQTFIYADSFSSPLPL